MNLQQKKFLESLPVEERFLVLKAMLKRSYADSLFKTAKYLLDYEDINLRTHGDMINTLEDTSMPQKLIVMPRGTFKSSIGCVSYPIWLLLKNPNLRIFITSEVYTNSKNFLREIKGKLRSEKFHNEIGDWEKDASWTEGEITINTRTKVLKEASITCGGVETVKVGQHYDVIIADDLNSDNNSATQEGRKKVLNYFRMLTSILDPGGIIAIIGTRYAVDDVIGNIITNEATDKQRAELKLLGVA